MIKLTHYTPKEIAYVIRRSVIGQDIPIQTVATALSAHISRCIYNQTWQGIRPPLQKDNLLIAGPTGTGKTESIRTVIRELQLPLPVAVIPVNTLSGSGYKGRNVEDILWDLAHDARRLLNSNPALYISDDDYKMEERNGQKVKKVDSETSKKIIIELCQNGIMILDEFDKLAYSSKNEYEGVYVKRVQFELLKMIEGTKGLSEDDFVQKIDTSNILFICLGAFSDLLKPPPERAAIGFAQDDIKTKSERNNDDVLTTEKLVEYGFVEELIGRIPLRCRYNALSVNNLYRILTESDVSPVDDFEELFNATDNELKFDQSALKEIAKRAYDIQTGARGLRTVMSEILYPILYEVDGLYKNRCVKITKNTVNGGKPVIKPFPTFFDRLKRT